MIKHTHLTLRIDVDPGVTKEELRQIKRFLEIEQDRLQADFAEVFGLVPTTSVWRPRRRWFWSEVTA